MGQINPKITIGPVYFGMLLLSAAVMISAVRLTVDLASWICLKRSPSRGMSRRSSIWVACMTLVAAFPKTISRQCDGFAWLPSRDLPRRSSIWVTCIAMVAAFPKLYRGSAMVSHSRRAGRCQGAVQSG